MTQTSTEFLFKWINDNLSESLIPIHIKEQAKEMEKQQIYEAFYDGEENAHKYKSSPTLYYNETYVSKGSDDHVVDTNEMVSAQTDENGKPLTYWGGVDFTNKNAHLIKSNSTTSSQTEISDEEIRKAAKNCRYGDISISVGSFELGARWYREQLKQRQ